MIPAVVSQRLLIKSPSTKLKSALPNHNHSGLSRQSTLFVKVDQKSNSTDKVTSRTYLCFVFEINQIAAWRLEKNVITKLPKILKNLVRDSGTKSLVNRGRFAKISFSRHFFVSRWILPGVGLRPSMIFLFWFLFLFFQCYRSVAYPLQSL